MRNNISDKLLYLTSSVLLFVFVMLKMQRKYKDKICIRIHLRLYDIDSVALKACRVKTLDYKYNYCRKQQQFHSSLFVVDSTSAIFKWVLTQRTFINQA